MLNIDPIVKVKVNVGTSMASAGVFDVGAIIGSTAIAGEYPLDRTHRYQVYKSILEVANAGFADTTEEYKAAAKYFGVSPTPTELVMIYFDGYADAVEYDNTKTYAIGDRCIHTVDETSKRYSCNTAIETAEDWTASHWDEITDIDNPVIAMLEAIEQGAEFYGVYYIDPGSAGFDADTQVKAISSALISLKKGVVFYGVTGTVASVTSSGLLPDQFESGDERSIGMYCTTEVNDAAGLMGVAMGLVSANPTNAFSLCYKGIASATPNNINQTEVENIKDLNGNVFVQRSRNRAFVENGAVANGLRFDDRLYIDEITYDIQQGIYQLIAESSTKLPQSDSTSALFLNTIFNILERYYTMGVLDTAIWRGSDVGDYLLHGDYVEHGHAEFVDSFDTQSEVDRAQHKAMPITVLLCLSGSVESIEITVDVQT